MIKNSKNTTFLLLCAGLAAGLGGCSTLEKHIPGIGSSATETSGSTAAEGVYYSGSPDLPLYRSPGGAIIKRLPQYTKVYRDELDQGFAHVRVDSTGEAGWVENAKLIWRLPKAKPSEPAPAAASQPAAESPAPQVVEPTPPPSPQVAESPESPPPPPPVEAPESPPPAPAAASPSSAPAKPSVAPSIFNPY